MAIGYRLIVDTDQYAGNFERPAVAYATGQLGFCEVGEEEAHQARAELPEAELDFWDSHTQQIANEYGHRRPVQLWPTPGWFNPGMGDCFPDTPDGRTAGLAAYRVAMANRAQDNRIQWTTPEGAEQDRRQREAQAQAAQVLTEPKRYPAMMSLAVELDAAPSAALVARFTERMRTFLATTHPLLRPRPVAVTAVRVEQFYTVTEPYTPV